MDEDGEELSLHVDGVCVCYGFYVVCVYFLKYFINSEEPKKPDKPPDPREGQISQLLLHKVLNEHGNHCDYVHYVQHVEEIPLLVG